MKILDHLTIELAGRNLIEASAGTGKTYAIVCLYLRLLIEQQLTPEQILVVTYTEAATEELRGRIRGRIQEALTVFSGVASNDRFLVGLRDNSNGKGPAGEKARTLLKLALYSFDTASIFTIHGFCLRALQDNAFESGSLYDTELVTEQNPLLQEIADDFWRIHFFSEGAPFLDYALNNKYTPDYFLSFLKGMLSNPKLAITPIYSTEAIAAIEQEVRECFAAVGAQWRTSRSEIVEIITHDKGLSRAKDNYKPEGLADLFAEMCSYTGGDNAYILCTGFDKFCSSGILRRTKEKGAAPVHPFFELCERLLTKVDERFLALRGELVEYGRMRLPLRKRELNIRFFDDLLNDLYTALGSKAGQSYGASLRGKFQAALIDEFQDTDPVQYDIFRKIYTDSTCPLFLIGDPKQAIYSFRGADIFAYLEAAADVQEERRYTLTENWRSTPALLAGLNAVLSNAGKPFVYDEIAYHPVKAGTQEDGKQLVCDERDNAPLQVWCLPAGDGGKPLTVGGATGAIPGAIAAEISQLLHDGQADKARIGDKKLLPGDIAVIVPSHRQAALIQDALQEAGIPSVMRSDKSIFCTDEAREVCILLAALADPGNETKIRTALVTDLLGRSGNDIARLLDDEKRWEEQLENFRAYHHLWLERGFMVMSQSLMASEGVRGRLLRRTDGERRLTNVLHCFELIHKTAHEKGLGSDGLLTWFGERVTSRETGDQYQIRLETDEKMVKIVTVHVSKGLEYPVVFCPFMWGGLKGNTDVVTFHENFKMVKDYGSPDIEQHRVLAQKESLAESLRLLYVALTRAKYRCYLIGGKVVGRKGVSEPETSSLAYLLHASDAVKSSPDVVTQLAAEVGALSWQEMAKQLTSRAEKQEGNISVAEMSLDSVAHCYTPRDNPSQFKNRKFSGTIESDWRVSSFTSFTAHGDRSVELPDRDETAAGSSLSVATTVDERPTGMGIFTFYKGAQPGIFLHSLFEKLDFTDCSEKTIRDLVTKGLEKSGYAAQWEPCISAMVTSVVSIPLSSPEGTFTLAELKWGRWIVEFEFFFPLKFITSRTLKEYFKKWGSLPETAELSQLCPALNFKPVQGMVRGFMDMVFEQGGRYYLVDWKSNHLGHRVDDYNRETLKQEMVRNLYILQYLLYTVALNRYLSLRVTDYDYERHFGGVIYFFLRGVRPERGEECGIFRDLPPVAMINDLTECLIQAGG